VDQAELEVSSLRCFKLTFLDQRRFIIYFKNSLNKKKYQVKRNEINEKGKFGNNRYS
jgi:hypothetical protein